MNKYIRFDWAMKRLLRNKANFVVLEGFLSVLLEQDIKSHCSSTSVTSFAGPSPAECAPRATAKSKLPTY